MPVSPRGELLRTSNALVFFTSCTPVFIVAAQEMPLEHLAVEATEVCILESQGAITIREAVLGRVPPLE